MSLNHIILTGKCAEPGPKLTYNATSAKPECKLTLIVEDGKGEQTFSLYAPVFIYGPGAERAAEEVDAGDIIAIDGRLSWKSTLKKDGAKLGLCVSTFGVEILIKAEVPVGVTADLELASEPEPTPAPRAKPRKPRLPAHLRRPWTPTPVESSN